jgi:prolyl 4-hydroxylase
MIKIIDNILTETECNELLQMGLKNGLTKANTLGENITSYRSADNTWIWETNELVTKIQTIVQNESGLPIENQEKIHIVKYGIGGEYKTHHDFFHPNTDYYDSSMGTSGQRVFSFLFYLNDDFTGGETEFPKKDTIVTPQTGRLLIWRNLNEDRTLDYDSLHAGLPVLSGEKNIAIVWVRENSFESNTNLINNTTTMELLPIHCDLGKILADYECSMLANETLQEKENGILLLETDERYYKNSFGGAPHFSLNYLTNLLPLAEKVSGVKLKPANSWVRIYNNGSTLNPHKDRDGLDYTISVCLFSNISGGWNLVIKNDDGQIVRYPTIVGNASFISGKLLEHWRAPLKCNDGECVIQMFLHYTVV